MSLLDPLYEISPMKKDRHRVGRIINYHLYCSVNSLKGWAERCTSDGLIRKYVEPIWPYVEQYHDEVIKRKLIIY